MKPRRAAAGIVLGAAGMLASRLRGRGRGEQSQQPAAEPQPDPETGERTPSSDEIERARADLAEELARHSARADNSPG